MDLEVLGRIMNAALKTHGKISPSDVELVSVYGDENVINLSTKVEGKTLSMTLRKMEESKND